MACSKRIGRRHKQMTFGGAASGVAKGAAAGSALGPIGTGVGAVVGGIAGAITSGKRKREAEEHEEQERIAQQQAMSPLEGSYNPYTPIFPNGGLIDGEIVELRCTIDPDTRGGYAPDGRKVKSTIHWVSADYAIDSEVRLYDRLFTVEDPAGQKNADYKDIKIERDVTKEAAFIKEIMDINKCGAAEALKTFKNMSRMILVKGTQFIRKEED